MASANITKATVEAFCKKYGVQLELTATGGKVTVDKETKEWNWTAKGVVPPRAGVLAFLRENVPQVAVDFPAAKGKSGDKGRMTVAALIDDSFLSAFSVEELNEVKAHLDTYIPKRLEAAKSADLATAVALLKQHGVTAPKDVFALIAPDKAEKGKNGGKGGEKPTGKAE